MNIMLDLETMGKGPDAAIVAIGAVEFDLENGELGREFYRRVCMESAVADGGVIDPNVVIWWMRQSDEARAEISGDAPVISDVLIEFRAWLDSIGQNLYIWGNGSDFDNVILRQAYRRANMDVPWAYWNNRCYRTAVSPMLSSIKINTAETLGTKHNALDDAKKQAQHLIKVYMPRVDSGT